MFAVVIAFYQVISIYPVSNGHSTRVRTFFPRSSWTASYVKSCTQAGTGVPLKIHYTPSLDPVTLSLYYRRLGSLLQAFPQYIQSQMACWFPLAYQLFWKKFFIWFAVAKSLLDKLKPLWTDTLAILQTEWVKIEKYFLYDFIQIQVK